MRSRDVSVISECDQTVQGTLDYLRRAGMNAWAVRVDDADCETSRDGVVLFADDFPREVVLSALIGLRRSCTVLVIVTDDVNAFARRLDDDVRCGRLVVLQRPVWGWMLVEALQV